jgi:hypothetical protein
MLQALSILRLTWCCQASRAGRRLVSEASERHGNGLQSAAQPTWGGGCAVTRPGPPKHQPGAGALEPDPRPESPEGHPLLGLRRWPLQREDRQPSEPQAFVPGRLFSNKPPQPGVAGASRPVLGATEPQPTMATGACTGPRFTRRRIRRDHPKARPAPNSGRGAGTSSGTGPGSGGVAPPG